MENFPVHWKVQLHSFSGWGHGLYGQLGLGHTETIGDDAHEMGDNLPEVDLGSGRSAQQVTAGAWHSCALLDDFSVKCWGAGLSSLPKIGAGTPWDAMGDHHVCRICPCPVYASRKEP